MWIEEKTIKSFLKALIPATCLILLGAFLYLKGICVGVFIGLLGIILIAPHVSALFGDVSGVLLFPRKFGAKAKAIYGIPRKMTQEGHFEEALLEYENILKEFPGEARPYIEMLDLCYNKLNDIPRGEAIYQRGIETLEDEVQIAYLEQMNENLVKMALAFQMNHKQANFMNRQNLKD